MGERMKHLRDLQVCRFCLDDVGPFTNIYEKDARDGNQQIPLPLQIMACVAIEVFSNDGMPKLICNPCRSQTIGAYNFKTTCKKADDTLKLYLATGNRKLVKPLLKKRAFSKNTGPIEHITGDKPQPKEVTTLNTAVPTKRPLSLTPSNNTSKRLKLTTVPTHSDDEHPDTETIHITMETDPLASESSHHHHHNAPEDGEIVEEILPTAPRSNYGYQPVKSTTMTSDGVKDGYGDGGNSAEEEGGGETEEEGRREGRYDEYDEDEEEDEEDAEQKSQQRQQIVTNIYPCTICDRSFPLIQQLELHLRNHDRVRSFSCAHDGCGRMFFNKYDLAKHSQTHFDYKPFTCVVCEKTFARESLLHRHEKVHVNVPKYLCTHCDRSFLNREDYDSHMEKHNKRRPFQCRICNKSFVFKQGLERHEVTHTDEKPHKCNYCEASFTSPIKLMRHITSHAGLRPYPCKLCGRTFLLSHHLTRHLKSHYTGHGGPGTDPPIGQHKCDVCSMSFRRKDSLINHSAIHSMVNLECVICNTAFENAKQVKQHITSHLSSLPYPCDKCDYSFDTQDQLEVHELKHAEMEYEEQIEAEVTKEALDDYEAEEEQELEVETRERTAYKVEDEDEEDDGEDEFNMTEFTITDSGLVPLPRSKNQRRTPLQLGGQQYKPQRSTNIEQQPQPLVMSPKSTTALSPVIARTQPPPLVPAPSHNQQQQRDITDLEPNLITEAEVITPHQDVRVVNPHDERDHDQLMDGDESPVDDKKVVTDQIRNIQKGEGQEGHEVPVKLKEIVRSEGTKVYARKVPVQKFKPQMMAPPAATMAPLSQINQSTLETLGLTQQDVNSMPTKKYMDMKVGDKTVRVQKLIMTKAEIAAMAKEGKIEMKGGNLILKKTTKGPLSPIKSSSSSSSKKPTRISLENILDQAPKVSPHKQRIVTKKTYVKRTTTVPTSVATSIAHVNSDLTITPIMSTSNDVIKDNLTTRIEHVDISTDEFPPAHSIEEVNI